MRTDWPFWPHAGQRAAYNSPARFTLMLAGAQGGKTSWLPWLLAREAVRLDREGDYLAVTSSFDLFRLRFLPAMREVFEHTLRIGRYWPSSRVIELASPERGFLARRADDPMFGRIILRSASSPGGLESATARAAILDEAGQEAFSLDVWEAVLRRLSLAQGRVWIGTTLYQVSGWLRDLYDRWLAGEPDISVIQFPSTINPQFPPAEFERARNSMQDWRFSMAYLGEYVNIPSLIFGAYDPLKHDVPPGAEIKRWWDVVVGVDPSGSHCATLWLAFDPQARQWTAFRETFDAGNTTRENVEKAKDFAGAYRNITFVGGGPSENQERADWMDAGIDLMSPPFFDLEPGIDKAVGLLKSGRLRIFDNLVELKREFRDYRRKMDDDGTIIDTIVDKPKFHVLDALRSAASYIEGGGPVVRGPSPFGR